VASIEYLLTVGSLVVGIFALSLMLRRARRCGRASIIGVGTTTSHEGDLPVTQLSMNVPKPYCAWVSGRLPAFPSPRTKWCPAHKQVSISEFAAHTIRRHSDEF
jgi:hypothetical protein